MQENNLVHTENASSWSDTHRSEHRLIAHKTYIADRLPEKYEAKNISRGTVSRWRDCGVY